MENRYRYTGGVQIQMYRMSTDTGKQVEYRYRYTGGVQIQVYWWSTDTSPFPVNLGIS